MKIRFLILIVLLAGATAGQAQPLMLRCATNKTVECFSAWTFDLPDWIGACPPTGAATLTVVSTVTNGPCPLIVTRTWKVTDDCGNMATCSQSVTNTDTRAPTITCAPDQTVECGTPWTFPLPTAFDHCTATADLIFSVVSTTTNATCPPTFIATRIWQVADLCTNTAICTQSVAVVDTTPPVIACPTPITKVACTNSMKVSYKIAATDACSPSVTILVSCVPPSGSFFSVGTTVVNCTAADPCGNSSSCSFTVNVVNNYFWQWLPCGIDDCYAPPTEPTALGACLTAAYPAGLWKPFDNTSVNRWVGHTWNFPASWNILGAQLLTRARPPVNGCNGSSANDTISLGLTNCSPAMWHWSRFFGNGNPSAGLVNTQWCNGTGCNYAFTFDLAALPLTPSGTTSLLPHMNSAKRLDLFVQDDTTVDFASLRVLRCAPQVLGGLAVELANARLVHAPAAWCVALENPELPFSADLRLGEAAGLRLPVEPLALAAHPDSSLEFGGGDLASGAFPRLAFSAGVQDPGEVRLNGLPPGVPVIDLAVLVDGVVVQSTSVPASDGMLVATFDTAHPLVELALANNDELLATVLEPGQGQPMRVTLRVSLPGYTGGFTGARLLATGIPEICVQQPELQMPWGVAGDGGHPAHILWSDRASLAEVSGGQFVLSALESDPAATMGFTASFPPTNEFRAAIQTTLGQFAPTPSNASLTLTLMRDLGSQPEDFVALNFGYTGSDWTLTARASNAPLSLARVEVYLNGTNLAAVANPASVQVAQLPDNFWASSFWSTNAPHEFCYRFPYASLVVVRVNGTAYVADDFLVLTAFPGQDLQTPGRLRVETTGAEALALAQLETGPMRYRVEPPELEGDDIIIRGNTLGAVFQTAHEAWGPWATAFTESGELRAKITNAPQMFYRIKGR